MPMNMPTLADLQDLYGAGSVSALQQAEQQQGLARQYAQGELSGQTQDIRKKELANIFDEQQNPQLLEQRRLENIGLGNTNIEGGVKARRAAANEGMQLTEDQRKFAITATDQDLLQANQWAQGEMQSGDPRRMEEAKKILDFTVAARSEKAKEIAAMERQREQTRSASNVAGIHAKSALDIEDKRIGAGKYNQKSFAMSTSNRLASARNAAQKAEILEEAYYTALDSGDNEAAAVYAKRAQQARERAAEDARNRALGAPGIGAATTPEGGIELQNKPVPAAVAPIAGGGAPAPQMTAQDQAALAWANANPNDPRAVKIKQKLGR